MEIWLGVGLHAWCPVAKDLWHFKKQKRARKVFSYCCDRKSQAACAQSFAPWQQATIEFTRRDHSNIACSCHICILLFFAHILFVVNHTFNVMPPERLQHLLFATNHTDRTFFLWRLRTARPPHPGNSTILLQSEIPSGMCAKLAPWQQATIEITRRDHSRCYH